MHYGKDVLRIYKHVQPGKTWIHLNKHCCLKLYSPFRSSRDFKQSGDGAVTKSVYMNILLYYQHTQFVVLLVTKFKLKHGKQRH